jgi:hypothetical protein
VQTCEQAGEGGLISVIFTSAGDFLMMVRTVETP